MSETLEVADLNLVLDGAGRRLHVVRGIDLTLRKSEVLGLIGESGSGKTMAGMSLLRLEPEGSEITARTLRLGGTDLLTASRSELRSLRGSRIAMIFQDPVGAFNPAKRIGWHVREVLRRRGVRAWRQAALERLAEVDITDADRVLAAYPHQLSGGMLQRVLIALVLAAEPQVIIADNQPPISTTSWNDRSCTCSGALSTVMARLSSSSRTTCRWRRRFRTGSP